MVSGRRFNAHRYLEQTINYFPSLDVLKYLRCCSYHRNSLLLDVFGGAFYFVVVVNMASVLFLTSTGSSNSCFPFFVLLSAFLGKRE